LTTSRPRVLLTDHAWPGVDVEAGLCDAAGFDLVEAPPGATEDELATLAADVDGILTCWAQVTAKVIAASPALRVVSRMGIGLDNIDLAAAATRRITVTRVPDYCVEEVSDHVVGLLHAWARCILTADRDVRAGITDPGRYAPRRVSSLVAGVWGLGPTGHRTAEKLVMMCDQEHVALGQQHVIRSRAARSWPTTGTRSWPPPGCGPFQPTCCWPSATCSACTCRSLRPPAGCSTRPGWPG
jgi:lactate dehydrogenase-like 2-hydroxyacid dehydrogenase